MTPSLAVELGPVPLKNPVIVGSSEFTMTEGGIRACIDAGAAAVVAKSINEDPAAARQLGIAEYMLLDARHAPRSWSNPEITDSLFNRSGLARTTMEGWVAMLDRCEAYARSHDSMVIGSITVSAPEPAGDLARLMGEVVGCIELNLSAPHGKESASGAVRQVGTAEGVAQYTSAVRARTEKPLIVKLTSQTTDVTVLAKAALDAGADIVAMIGRFQGFLPDLDTGLPQLGSAAAIGGGWALPISLYWVSKSHVAMPTVPLIGTNGARNGGDVIRFLLSGASAVEIVSAVLMHGPSAIDEAVAAVNAYLTRRGISDIGQLVGAAARASHSYGQLMAKRGDAPPILPWQAASYTASPLTTKGTS